MALNQGEGHECKSLWLAVTSSLSPPLPKSSRRKSRVRPRPVTTSAVQQLAHLLREAPSIFGPSHSDVLVAAARPHHSGITQPLSHRNIFSSPRETNIRSANMREQSAQVAATLCDLKPCSASGFTWPERAGSSLDRRAQSAWASAGCRTPMFTLEEKCRHYSGRCRPIEKLPL